MGSLEAIQILLSITAFTAVMVFWMGFFPENTNFLKDRIMGKTTSNSNASIITEKNLFGKVIIPLARYFQKYVHKYASASLLASIDTKLEAAGRPFNLTAMEVYSMRYSYMLILSLMFGLFGKKLSPENAYLFLLAGLVVGFFAPSLWLDGIIKKRRLAVTIQLPSALDLLSVCTSSGMSLTNAMGVVCDKMDGVLSVEFRKVLREIEKGSKTVDAFKNLTVRCDTSDIADLYQHIRLSLAYGSPISKSLYEIGEIIRKRNYDLVRERASKAAANVLFPVVLFIFPALFIILAGPAAMQFLANM